MGWSDLNLIRVAAGYHLTADRVFQRPLILGIKRAAAITFDFCCPAKCPLSAPYILLVIQTPRAANDPGHNPLLISEAFR
jgi:hypothetical protein